MPNKELGDVIEVMIKNSGSLIHKELIGEEVLEVICYS